MVLPERFPLGFTIETPHADSQRKFYLRILKEHWNIPGAISIMHTHPPQRSPVAIAHHGQFYEHFAGAFPNVIEQPPWAFPWGIPDRDPNYNWQ